MLVLPSLCFLTSFVIHRSSSFSITLPCRYSRVRITAQQQRHAMTHLQRTRRFEHSTDAQETRDGYFKYVNFFKYSRKGYRKKRTEKIEKKKKKKSSHFTYTAPKYLENIGEIFLGNIVRLGKYVETYH